MKSDILPIWEDERNKNCSYCTTKISNVCENCKCDNHLYETVLKFIILFLTNSITNNDFYDINGLTIKYNNNSLLIKIWINNKKKTNKKFFNELLDYKFNFSPFKK